MKYVESSLRDLKQSIQQQILPRYQQLESREQMIVLLAAIVLPVMIMIFGIILPLHDTQQALHKELRIVQSKAAEADRLASYLKKHGTVSESANSAESLLTTVERLARQTSVRRFIARIKPQSSPNTQQQQLMLRMKAVPYDAALRFIHALAERGLGLKSMKLQRTKAPGMVNLYAMISEA